MKAITSFLALVLTVTTLTYSRPAKAIVGCITGNPTTLLGGLALVGVGGIGMGINLSTDAFDDVPGSVGALFIIAGLIVLDAGAEQELSFTDLDQKAARRLKVTEADRNVYNAELDMANFVMGQVNSELEVIKKPTKQDARRIWTSYQDLVSPATFSVMTKIAAKVR